MTLRDPLWRNLGIVAVVSALLTAAGQGGRVAGILFLMPLRSRILLYGSAIGIVLLIATGDLWASSSALAALVFFAALFGLGYVLYRCWQESRRYFY